MIFFGYKTKFSSMIRALSAIGIGLVMLLHSDASVVVVKIIAALLVVAGIVSLVHGFAKREEGALPLMSVNGGVDIVLGLILFFWPGAVAGFIVFAIGLVLVVFGLLQFVVMSGTVTLLGKGFLPLLLSGLCVLGGITLMFQPWESTIMSRIAGFFLVYYGVTELLSAQRMVKAKEAYDIQFTKKEEPAPQESLTALDEVKDVEYEKVEDPEETGVWTSSHTGE